MGTWTVHFTGKAYKQPREMPRRIQDMTDLAVLDMEKQGVHPRGWKVRKTSPGEYRLRITYRYRLRFRVMNEEIEVFYVGHRREAYRWVR